MDDSPSKQACAAEAKHGAQCRAFALPGGDYCQTHDPERQEHVRELRSRGGKMSALRGRRRRLQTVGALVRYGGERLQDLEDGTIGLELGRALFYALAVQAKLVELHQTSDFEHRLAALEERLPATPKGRAMPWVG